MIDDHRLLRKIRYPRTEIAEEGVSSFQDILALYPWDYPETEWNMGPVECNAHDRPCCDPISIMVAAYLHLILTGYMGCKILRSSVNGHIVTVLAGEEDFCGIRLVYPACRKAFALDVVLDQASDFSLGEVELALVVQVFLVL